MRRMELAGGMLAAAFVWMASTGVASALRVCVPKKEGASIVTPRHGKCRKGYRATSLGGEGKQGPQGKAGAEGKQGAEGKPGPEGKAGFTAAEAEQLKNLLPYIKLVSSGIGGKATVVFSGVNVQLVNGEGKTKSANGAGNLVIGYDELPAVQTGSHNLILGDEFQEFTSFGGIDAGTHNAIRQPFDAIIGGHRNEASAELGVVAGGEANVAGGSHAVVLGGYHNTASGEFSSISGGDENAASGLYSSVSAGNSNKAGATEASVSGGFDNSAAAFRSAIGGGKQQTTTLEYEFKP